MNEEIKEIVVDNGELIAYYKDGSFQTFDTLSQEVLDYITNLQQELEEYKDTETYSKRFLYKANKDRLNANLELEKKIRRL